MGPMGDAEKHPGEQHLSPISFYEPSKISGQKSRQPQYVFIFPFITLSASFLDRIKTSQTYSNSAFLQETYNGLLTNLTADTCSTLTDNIKTLEFRHTRSDLHFLVANSCGDNDQDYPIGGSDSAVFVCRSTVLSPCTYHSQLRSDDKLC